MEKFTKRGLRKTWAKDSNVALRAKRGKGTSAPNKEELMVYKKFFKKAIEGEKNPRVLVKGVTPELVDLAVSLGCETVAVDISTKLIEKMRAVMKYRDSPKLHIVNGDWLKMDKFLNAGTFNIVTGDTPLPNIPLKKIKKSLKIIAKLLKKNGYLVMRHLNFEFPKKFRSVSSVISEFKRGRNTLLGVYVELGFATKFAKLGFNPKKSTFSWENVRHPVYNVMEKGRIGKTNLKYAKNLRDHTGHVIHNLFSQKEFEKMLSKNFVIKETAVVKKYVYSVKYLPIYFAKKKYSRR